MNTAKIQDKGQVTIPTNVRRKVGLLKGDLVDFAVKGSQIIITPKIAIHRSEFLTADDEYTPAQRKIIDAELAEGLADIKAGRTPGPFNTAQEMIAHMKLQLQRRAAAKKSKRAR